MRESLTIQRAIPSSSAALLAETIEALARTDREGASEASAEALHLEAIEILKHAPAAESLHLMRAYLDLAEVYEDHKQYEKAVDEYEKAVPLAIQYYRANQAIPAAVTEASLALALTRDSLLRSRKIKETEKLWSVELELVDECGDQRRVFDVLKAFARFCEDHEVADETARTAVTRLFTVANELGEKDTRQWCLNLMADMELRMGNAAKATPSLFMEQGGEIATGVQAALEFKNGNYSQAEKLFGSCIDSSLSRLNPGSDQLNLVREALKSVELRAKCLVETNRESEADQAVATVWQRISESGNPEGELLAAVTAGRYFVERKDFSSRAQPILRRGMSTWMTYGTIFATSGCPTLLLSFYQSLLKETNSTAQLREVSALLAATLASDRLPANDKEAVDNLLGQGAARLETLQYDAAMRCFDQALSITAKYDKGTELGKICHRAIGNIYWKRGQYKQAEEHFRQCVDNVVSSLLPVWPDLNQLCRLLVEARRFTAAEPLIQRALVLAEANSNDVQTYESLVLWKETLKQTGRIELADVVEERAKSMGRKSGHWLEQVPQ